MWTLSTLTIHLQTDGSLPAQSIFSNFSTLSTASGCTKTLFVSFPAGIIRRSLRIFHLAVCLLSFDPRWAGLSTHWTLLVPTPSAFKSYLVRELVGCFRRLGFAETMRDSLSTKRWSSIKPVRLVLVPLFKLMTDLYPRNHCRLLCPRNLSGWSIEWVSEPWFMICVIESLSHHGLKDMNAIRRKGVSSVPLDCWHLNIFHQSVERRFPRRTDTPALSHGLAQYHIAPTWSSTPLLHPLPLWDSTCQQVSQFCPAVREEHWSTSYQISAHFTTIDLQL